MNISEYLCESRVEIGAELYSKNAALEKLIRLQKNSGAIHNPRALWREIDEHERRGNSAVAGRIAIPHTMHSGALHTCISAITLQDGIDYQAPDKRPVKLIFLIAGKSGSQEHLTIRNRLMHLLSDPEFTARLCAAQSSREFLKLIKEKEQSSARRRSLNSTYHSIKILDKNHRKS